jgi:Na+-translocating ferredoxin:NAD+ oxidoreductase RnfC subunit
MRKLAYAQNLESLYGDTDVRQALLCCECGICELYACPMQLQPRRINAMIKAELSRGGLRYPKGEGQRELSEAYDYRKVPTKRAAGRAGVLSWYDACGTEACKEHEPQTVTLALRQGAGVPSLAIVGNGERVEAGQLIAACPEGKLGARLHTGIGGVAKIGPESITITKEGLPT